MSLILKAAGNEDIIEDRSEVEKSAEWRLVTNVESSPNTDLHSMPMSLALAKGHAEGMKDNVKSPPIKKSVFVSESSQIKLDAVDKNAGDDDHMGG